MGFAFGFFLLLILISSAVAILLTTPPERIASAMRMAAPFALLASGAGLTLIGRVSLGLPLLVFGFTLWRRNRNIGAIGRAGSGRKSTVRSAMFEMQLDHESGEMDGTVLTGRHEGSSLSSLSEQELMEMLRQTGQDAESAALLETYLDRRFPGWRENADAHTDSRHGRSSGSGPVTKEEAYQILGLAPGAGAKEIREAHRRLMKKIHPDSGGSTFLASKINEAKDVLLG
jgi:DnaJ domain